MVDTTPMRVALEPLEVRAVYANYRNISSAERRSQFLELMRQSSSNAVVVTVKDTDGKLRIPVGHPLAEEIGAFREEAGHHALKEALAEFKSHQIYTIARVAIFKDGLLARNKPETALRSIRSRKVIRGTGNIAWTNPSLDLVQEYNLEVARTAARMGFDEVMLDFIRYPATSLSREGATVQENDRRLKVIVGFLRAANAALGPHGVYLGATVFGSVCTMRSVGAVGQKLEEFAESVDYVFPMLYPSQFQRNAKYPRPVEQPYNLIRDNLLAAASRVGDRRKLRPWLQNFPDEADPDTPLGVDQIGAQIKAADDVETSGWMLWDSRSRYINTRQAVNKSLAMNLLPARSMSLQH